jgi:hypothetical protein
MKFLEKSFVHCLPKSHVVVVVYFPHNRKPEMFQFFIETLGNFNKTVTVADDVVSEAFLDAGRDENSF